jgi:hypothetical protein
MSFGSVTYDYAETVETVRIAINSDATESPDELTWDSTNSNVWVKEITRYAAGSYELTVAANAPCSSLITLRNSDGTCSTQFSVNALEKDFSWSTSDTSIASVVTDSDGKTEFALYKTGTVTFYKYYGKELIASKDIRIENSAG